MKTNLEDVDLLHLYNAREAAVELGLSHETLRAYAKKWGLGEKKGHEWRFSKAEIEMLSLRPQRGRPKKSLLTATEVMLLEKQRRK